jgi:hypothetical protein
VTVVGVFVRFRAPLPNDNTTASVSTAGSGSVVQTRPIDICCSYIIRIITTAHRKYQGYYYRYSHHYVCRAPQ